MQRMMRAVVIGASGGIGGALARSLTERETTVASFARASGDGRWRQIDLLDEASIRAAATTVDDALDLVIIATGILHADGIAPEKSLRALDAAALTRVFAVNAIGPALVAKHFVPKLRKDGRAVFAALSARVGSITDNRLGGWYGYRASKAALNQMLRTLSIEVARTRPQAIVLGLHPGTVATGLSQPFRSADDPAVFTPDRAAKHLLDVLDAATPAQSGQVLAWDGSVVPP